MAETRGFPPVTLPLQVQLNTTKVPVVYAYELAFERSFDHEWGVGLFQQYWTIGFPLSAIYGVLILAGQCGGVYRASGLWAWLFAVSKLVEFGDTAFIVLRKQNLMFLHWYHHITVLLYTWFSYAYYTSTGRCFLLMNYTVHAFMYTYYALKASRIVLIPRRVSFCITVLQITQMFTGILVNLYAHVVLKRGDVCAVSRRNLEASFFMYVSYFVLFAHYFYRAYFVKKRRNWLANFIPSMDRGKQANRTFSMYNTRLNLRKFDNNVILI
ncbi:elongation of very long chain fatty acids protein 6-like [Patiria miniata]|uniref:Elongation of very long chain fatty acids protein n=1 Tax=Patiria miniata TaxID=46514 RepID=A0A914ACE5_PATMI|nr:elongation of very long chain fatty acids protein 6-like [Patiria miniata]